MITALSFKKTEGILHRIAVWTESSKMGAKKHKTQLLKTTILNLSYPELTIFKYSTGPELADKGGKNASNRESFFFIFLHGLRSYNRFLVIPVSSLSLGETSLVSTH